MISKANIDPRVHVCVAGHSISCELVGGGAIVAGHGASAFSFFNCRWLVRNMFLIYTIPRSKEKAEDDGGVIKTCVPLSSNSI